MTFRPPVSATISAFLVLCSSAYAAPPALLNKTVTISYSVSASDMDGPRSSGTRAVVRTLYISGAGRIFSRADRREGRNTEKIDKGPDRTAGSFRFAGDKLVGVLPFASGAAQLTVNFDRAGQSCTASVKGGRENGQAYRWKAVNGEMHTGSLMFSGESCSIRDGNAFGD